jgi:endonuclease/exonuclease/phosphatase family metal-dependent hydrolase
VLGPDYAIGCHPGKPDKCLAVHQRVGSLRGCSAGLCLDALDGFTVDGCGSGARVARAVIDRVDGSALTVVSVHGSSGVATDDEACRVAQVEQVFVDLGDGEPGANGVTHLILGDLNTDPGRWAEIDASAARWNDFVSDSQPFHFITAVGPDAPGSYAGLADIDHVISDNLDGDCWHAGVDDGEPVFTTAYFDHVPAVCTL